MIRRLKASLQLVSSRTRRRLVISVPLVTAVSILETGALALVFLVIQAVVQPSSLSTNSYYQRVADFLGTTDPQSFMRTAGAIAFGLFFLRSALSALYFRWQFRVMAETEAEMSVRLYRHYMLMPYRNYIRRNTAEPVRTIYYTIEAFVLNIIMGLVYIFSESILALTISIFLIIAAPQAMLAAIAVLVVASVLYHLVLGKWSRKIGRQNQQAALEHLMELEDSFGAFKAIITTSSQPYFIDRYATKRFGWAVPRAKLLWGSQLPRYYIEFTTITLVIVATAVTVASQPEGAAIATLGVFVAGAFRLLPSLVRMLSATNALQLGWASMEIISKELEGEAPGYEAELRPDKNAKPVARERIQFNDRLVFRDVSFRYPSADAEALKHVSFEIRAGQSVGIAGHSGAGKTTIADLLLGLFVPEDGEILLDGRALHGEELGAWRGSVGYVPQDVLLLDDTLRRNIAFGRLDTDIDDEVVIEAAKRAELWEFIAKQPEGLDAKIGQRGVRISGGQRQRIGIARALIEHPDLLIFDEATSSLDVATEASISSTLSHLRSERTIVIIAHRFSTLRDCDNILFLDDGRLVGTGTFDELVASNNEFAHLAGLAGLVESGPHA